MGNHPWVEGHHTSRDPRRSHRCRQRQDPPESDANRGHHRGVDDGSRRRGRGQDRESTEQHLWRGV